MELWLQILVPVCLVIIMAAMGLELTLSDFRRIVSLPRAAGVGLVGQMLLLPALGFGFALAPGHIPGLATPMPPEVAVGMIVVVSCPGSAPSNVFTYLARGNTALSISLTAASSILTVFTIPIWVSLAVSVFYSEGAEIRLPLVRTILQLCSVTLLPVGIGMLIRARSPEVARRMRRVLQRAVPWLFVVVLIIILTTRWDDFSRHLPVAGPTAFLLSIVALASAFALAKLAALGQRDAFTIAIEVGLQNAALASLIIVNLLDRPEFLVFPSVYALLAAIPVTAWAIWFRRHGPATSE
ncbi:MAG: bile acid:sodium symporter family protein [Deltaproteobacteria bacterium]|nr:bile acid:sodium symporter family protein [Deltaproteobacteria bacterium]